MAPGFSSMKKLTGKVSLPSSSGSGDPSTTIPSFLKRSGKTTDNGGSEVPPHAPAPVSSSAHPHPPVAYDQGGGGGIHPSMPPHPVPAPMPAPMPTPPQENLPESTRPRLPGRLPGFKSPISFGKLTPPTPDATPSPGDAAAAAAKPSKTIKLPKTLRGITNLGDLEIEGSVLSGDLRITDSSEKQTRKEGLCSACSKINFEQFASSPSSSSSYPSLSNNDNDKVPHISYKLIFLDRIIRKNRNQSCRFCTLLFDAIASPANDPFNHPAVKNHLPPDLARLTFREWANGLNVLSKIPVYKNSYPFGRSRDSHVMEQKVDKDGTIRVEDSTREDDVTVSDVANVTAIGATAGLGGAMLTETDQQRMKIMMTVGTVIPTITSLMANLDSKLPVAVSIMLHNVGDADQGLLNVDVWGYGNGHRAPLSRISAFNLRVASGYERVSDDDGDGGQLLRYGNVIKPELDVEGDCKVWLDACLGCHGEGCARPGWSVQLPSPSGPDFRLVDVRNMRVVVVSSSPSISQVPRYAALSYVWGATGKYALNLHKHNADALAVSLLGQDRPVARTILDAIDVTRRLGLSYLWVDSLCIIQKSEFADPSEDDTAARNAQIGQMDAIYGNAEVTLVAACGEDAEAGLLFPREITPETQIACTVLSGPSPTPTPTPMSTPAHTPIHPTPDPLSTEPTTTTTTTTTPDKGINILLPIAYPQNYGKWDTRAWTLQEKLLSKRLLVFSQGGFVTFHCRRGVLREDMPSSHAGAAAGPPKIPWLELPEQQQQQQKQNSSKEDAYLSRVKTEWDGTTKTIHRAAFFDEYAKLVGEYSAREMTDSRDSLGAVAGLLRVLERMVSPLPSLPGGQGFSEGERGEEGLGSSLGLGLGLGHTLYGLPERFLDLALMWQPPAVEGTYLTRKPHDMLPSWSWAGWEVGVDSGFASDGNKSTKSSVAAMTKPGVRFDELFWVGVNDDLSLRKVVGVADGGTESVGGGGGFSLRGAFARAQEKAVSHLASKGTGTGAIPAGTNIRRRQEEEDEETRPTDERFRPLVLWYRSTTPPTTYSSSTSSSSRTTHSNYEYSHPHRNQPGAGTHTLVPINSNGLGLAFPSETETDRNTISELISHAASFSSSISPSKIQSQSLPSPPKIPLDIPLSTTHLVCKTQVATFRLRRSPSPIRKETLWKKKQTNIKGNTTTQQVPYRDLFITQLQVLHPNSSGSEAELEIIGTITPTDSRKAISSEPYHFILLSESQYSGDEKKVDVVGGMPWLNVMVVEWDSPRGEFATRVGVGKVRKSAWFHKGAGVVVRDVILR